MRGIIPFKTSREFVGEKLFDTIKPFIKEGDRILIPSSSKSRPFLAEELKKLGAIVTKINVYDVTKGEVKNTKAFDEVDAILFTSPSTFENMKEMVGLDKIKEKICIAIGPITNKALNESGVNSFVCKEHSQEGFLKEIKDILKEVH